MIVLKEFGSLFTDIEFLIIKNIVCIQSYFRDSWNTFDFITVVGSIVDALMVEFAVSINTCSILVLKLCFFINILFFSLEKLHQRRFSEIIQVKKAP